MDTTKIGNIFEEKIFDFLNDSINQGTFHFKADCCKIFRKKAYFSKERESSIIFDLSVEVYRPGSNNYSLLVLVECKNYNHPVPVDDVEEFFAKFRQISNSGIKGIIFSTNSFQSGTFAFAKNNNIALVRYFSKHDVKWELERSPSSLLKSEAASKLMGEAYLGLTRDDFHNKYFDFSGFYDDYYTHSSTLLFGKLFERDIIENGSAIDRKKIKIQIPYLSKEFIEDISARELEKIAYTVGEVPLEKICEFQKARNGLKVTYEVLTKAKAENDSMLGKIVFKPPRITIYLCDNNIIERQRFTLAHELGHLLLNHGKYMVSEYCEQSDLDGNNSKLIGLKEIIAMEWQANYFASALLLPKVNLIADFNLIASNINLVNRGFGALYLDFQPCNLDPYMRIVNELKTKYKVSIAAIRMRLINLGVIRDHQLHNFKKLCQNSGPKKFTSLNVTK